RAPTPRCSARAPGRHGCPVPSKWRRARRGSPRGVAWPTACHARAPGGTARSFRARSPLVDREQHALNTAELLAHLAELFAGSALLRVDADPIPIADPANAALRQEIERSPRVPRGAP